MTQDARLLAVWALPQEAVEAALQEAIDTAMGEVRFCAHMTIASAPLFGASGADLERQALVQRLAQAHAPISVSKRRLHRQLHGLRAQFVSFRVEPALMAFMDAGAQALQQRPRRRTPHISLSYGPPSRAMRNIAAKAFTALPDTIVLDRVQWALMDSPVTAQGVAEAKLGMAEPLAGR